jgi:hypothetical protein
VTSEKDGEWSASLVEKLDDPGPVVHFVRSSLSLEVDKTIAQGAVFQPVEKPGYFYIVNGDAMLRLGTKWGYNLGVGGFSLHAPRSRNFIVCLNLGGGVPVLAASNENYFESLGLMLRLGVGG